MTDLSVLWRSLLLEPAALDPARPAAWFEAIARRLLTGCRLRAGDRLHRLTEVEFYYHAAGHLDPFSHRQPLQRSAGRWYFHRSGGSYRGGSFKGLDLTFGNESSFGGILIRGLTLDTGTFLDGPSRLVDHLLRQVGKATVADLDAALASARVWSADRPLQLLWCDSAEEWSIVSTARVGLSLKRPSLGAAAPAFVLRPYRFLSEPRQIRQGRLQTVLALHLRGQSNPEIQAITGCPRLTVERYVAACERGRRESTFAPYLGTDLKPDALARLHGLWQARFGGA